MKNLKRGWILHLGGDLPLICPLCVNLIIFMLLDLGTGQGPLGRGVHLETVCFPSLNPCPLVQSHKAASCREVWLCDPHCWSLFKRNECLVFSCKICLEPKYAWSSLTYALGHLPLFPKAPSLSVPCLTTSQAGSFLFLLLPILPFQAAGRFAACLPRSFPF